jgi:hypothetical protein
VAEEELYLLEFAAGQVTESRARAPEVVRCQLLDAGRCSRRSDDIPQPLRRHPVAPDAAGSVDRAEDAILGDGTGGCPCVDRGLHPLRDGHGPDMTALADKIRDDPVQCSSRCWIDSSVSASRSGLLQGRRVDLVTAKFLNERIREQVLREAEPLYVAA